MRGGFREVELIRNESVGEWGTPFDGVTEFEDAFGELAVFGVFEEDEILAARAVDGPFAARVEQGPDAISGDEECAGVGHQELGEHGAILGEEEDGIKDGDIDDAFAARHEPTVDIEEWNKHFTEDDEDRFAGRVFEFLFGNLHAMGNEEEASCGEIESAWDISAASDGATVAELMFEIANGGAEDLGRRVGSFRAQGGEAIGAVSPGGDNPREAFTTEKERPHAAIFDEKGVWIKEGNKVRRCSSSGEIETDDPGGQNEAGEDLGSPEPPETGRGGIIGAGIGGAFEEFGGEPDPPRGEEKPESGGLAHIFSGQPEDRPSEQDSQYDSKARGTGRPERRNDGTEGEPKDRQSERDGEFEGVVPEPLGIGTGVLVVETGVVFVVEKPNFDKVESGPEFQQEDGEPKAEYDCESTGGDALHREGSAGLGNDEGGTAPESHEGSEKQDGEEGEAEEESEPGDETRATAEEERTTAPATNPEGEDGGAETGEEGI